jgi:hypothetical protein
MKILNCCNCNNPFDVSNKKYAYTIYKFKNTGKRYFCSIECRRIGRGTCSNFVDIPCDHCNKLFTKKHSYMKKSDRHFCTHSCAAIYNNTHKTKGNRRSKLEEWLEEQLTMLYPDLEIWYSDKTTINSELDIYIPSLNLAFELNGIFHYEPIFGEDKLSQIQNNDDRKFQACIEHGIELCIMDTSSQKRFKPSTSQKFLDIILNIIHMKISA